jgi:membrane protein
MTRRREILHLLRESMREFMDDDALTLGAALAFYTALSLAPLVVLMMWTVGSLGPSTQQQLIEQVVALVGPQAGEAVRSVAENSAARPSVGSMAGIISIVVLIFSATGVFAQLQHAMNLVWDLEAKPGSSLKTFVRTRLLSLGMFATIAFLLLVSLFVSAILSAMIGAVGDRLPGADFIWSIVDLVASIAVFSLIFGAVFKVLPDAKIGWRNLVFGSVLTAVLFTVGKVLIGLYLGQSSTASAYGAAGSLLVLLTWVYYSSLILFFGAEVTQVWARRRGEVIEPNDYAVPLLGSPRSEGA